MKVTIVSPYPARGAPIMAAGDSALNRYTSMLAHGLAARGDHVSVLGSQMLDRPENWEDGEVRVESCFDRHRASTLRNVVARAIDLPATIVHVQHELFAYGGLPGAFSLPRALDRIRRGRKRILTTIHGVIPLDSIDAAFVRGNEIPAPPFVARAGWRFLLRQVALASDAVHVHEARHADWLRADYGLRDTPIYTIPLGVAPSPPPADRDAARDALRIPHDARVALFFGFLAQYKGIDVLVREAPAMFAADPSLYLIVAGGAPERLVEHGAKMSVLVAQLARDFPDRVRATGFVPEPLVEGVIAAADVLLMPYTINMAASAPLGQALARGLPALISDAFATAYPTYRGTFGLEPGALAASVTQFFTSTELRAEAERFVREQQARAALPQTVARIEDAYRELVAQIGATR